MSWTDEEIDNLFQESANAQSFEYNNAYFSEVEAMLPVNKKGKDFLWMGTALLFVAVLTTGYFVNNTNDSYNNNDQLANLELNSTNENNTDSKAAIDGQESTNVNTERANQTDQPSNSDVTAKGLSSSEFGNTGSLNAKSTNASGKNTNSTLNQGNSYIPEQQVGWSKSMYAVDSNDKIRKAKAAFQAQLQTSASAEINTIEEQSSTNEEPIKLRADTRINNQKEFDVDRAPITANLNVNSLSQLDQGIDRGLMPNALTPLSLLRPKAAFYVELNTGLSQSLILPANNVNTSFGGGVGVESYLGRFNLTTGMNFKLSEHNDLFLTREASKKFGFGSTPGDRNTYDFKQIYSIELPISLGYNFGKHNVNIGVRPSFSFGANMKEQNFNGLVLIDSKESVGLIDGGVNRFGLKPTFGYSYHLNKWTIGANIGVQLMEAVDEEYIKGTNTQLPIDGQIYLRRTIRLRR